MSDHKALIEALSGHAYRNIDATLMQDARDAIQQLVGERDAMKGTADDAYAKWVQAERERDAADAALRAISLTLGGSDEWSDQRQMILDVQRQVGEFKREWDKAVVVIRAIVEEDW